MKTVQKFENAACSGNYANVMAKKKSKKVKKTKIRISKPFTPWKFHKIISLRSVFNLSLVSFSKRTSIYRWHDLFVKFEFNDSGVIAQCSGDFSRFVRKNRISSPGFHAVHRMAKFIEDAKKDILFGLGYTPETPDRLKNTSSDLRRTRRPSNGVQTDPATQTKMPTEEEFLRESWHSTDYG